MDERLQALCPIPLQIIWHENRTTYLTIRKERGTLFLRLHRLFLQAPTPVLEALIRMALKKRDKDARTIVRKMAHLYFSQNRMAADPLPTQGVHYDLLSILDQVRIRYFSPDLAPAIGWTPSRLGKCRSITFGSYDRHSHQIRINRLLDDPQVPLYFLEFIVYHELLHAVIPSRVDSAGRCRFHTAEFRQKEKLFHHFEEVKAWEKNCLVFFKKRKAGKSHGRT